MEEVHSIQTARPVQFVLQINNFGGEVCIWAKKFCDELEGVRHIVTRNGSTVALTLTYLCGYEFKIEEAEEQLQENFPDAKVSYETDANRRSVRYFITRE